MKLFNYIIIIIIFILLLNIVATITSFFGIGFSDYSIYMAWFIVLFILYLLLPAKNGILFNSK